MIPEFRSQKLIEAFLTLIFTPFTLFLRHFQKTEVSSTTLTNIQLTAMAVDLLLGLQWGDEGKENC